MHRAKGDIRFRLFVFCYSPLISIYMRSNQVFNPHSTKILPKSGRCLEASVFQRIASHQTIYNTFIHSIKCHGSALSISKAASIIMQYNFYPHHSSLFICLSYKVSKRQKSQFLYLFLDHAGRWSIFCLPSIFNVVYSSSMVPGGLEVLERRCQLKVGDQSRERDLLTGHRQHGPHPRPGCR